MDPVILLISVFVSLVIIGLSIVVVFRNAQVKEYRQSLLGLKQSFESLDEQAKLIVKTDLELNRAQEELDRRLNGLDALQRISRLISTTLDENEIFHRLDQSFLVDLDYEQSLVLLLSSDKTLYPRIHEGLSEESLAYTLEQINKNSGFLETIKEGHTYSSVNCPDQQRDPIIQTFGTEYFVISPILTQNGYIGIVYVGNPASAAPITSGDEELISILANQIGQAIENARLFEQVYRSSLALESKIQERTHQLEKALKEVQDISKAKSDFISAVSHELRTPLTSIKGYAEILMAGKLGEVPEAVHQRLGKINMHSDNLVKLINNLLDIARIESGRVEMNFSHTNLRTIITNVEDLLSPQMKSKNIQFKVGVDEHLPELSLDTTQIERVFINLIGNAIKFTPEKGTIGIKITQSDNEVRCEVSDTGIGIPEKDIERLFDEFYRVENEINQNVKGTGLGLPLAKKIIEAHGGVMWVTSQLNAGTTFHFTIPKEISKQKVREETL